MKNRLSAIALCLVSMASATSMLGLGALGEDQLPGDAALAGSAYAGSARVEDGYSSINPARMPFATKTQFTVTLDY